MLVLPHLLVEFPLIRCRHSIHIQLKSMHKVTSTVWTESRRPPWCSFNSTWWHHPLSGVTQGGIRTVEKWSCNMKIWPAHHEFWLRIMAATNTSFGASGNGDCQLEGEMHAIVNKDVDTFIKSSVIGTFQSQAPTLHLRCIRHLRCTKVGFIECECLGSMCAVWR